MIRVLFWILVAVGLGAFFFGASHQKTMTPEEARRFWGSVVTLVGLSVAFLCTFYLLWSLKSRVIVGPGAVWARGRVFGRDSQPGWYWSVFAIYAALLLCYGFMAYKTCREIFVG
jgi:FtsH-binding integral membrane protein